MKTARLALSLAFAILLGGGYASSQLAIFFGWPPDYYEKVDMPLVRVLALVLLLAAIVVGLVPDKEEPAA